MRKKLIYTIIITIIFSQTSCNAQENNDNNIQTEKQTNTMNRKPVVAGQFYPANETQLNKDLELYFANAEKKQCDNVLAILSPHAGYVFSGQVAASSFNQINENKEYEHIFIITSSHRAYFKGASIYNLGDYETPFGIVKLDTAMTNKLIKENDIFEYHYDAHSQEHSLEVQLPFLQHKMKKEFSIVPIVLGTQSSEECKKIAEVLKPYFNNKNLFIISTDFSHYPEYEKAVIIDSLTADAIVSNKTENFLNIIDDNKSKKIANLSTSICGWTSVLTLMYMTEQKNNINYKKIQYQNSGDSKYGDHNKVVGYYSIALSEKEITEKEFSLSKKDKKDLLKIARETIDLYTNEKKMYKIKTDDLSETLNEHCGTFVTLHKNGKLRGCIGRFEPKIPLYDVVQSMAISSATQDRRFEVVSKDELEDIEIEISVLTPLKKIESIDEFELGKHGIYIKKGYQSGTFLPQVAASTDWTKEEFLGHCARDKAGIGWTGWKDADLYIYRAIIFEEKDFED